MSSKGTNREHILEFMRNLLIDSSKPLSVGQLSKEMLFDVPPLTEEDRTVLQVSLSAHPLRIADCEENKVAHQCAMIALLYLRKNWKGKARKNTKRFDINIIQRDIRAVSNMLRYLEEGILHLKHTSTSKVKSAQEELDEKRVELESLEQAKRIKGLLHTSPIEQLIMAGQKLKKSTKGSRK